MRLPIIDRYIIMEVLKSFLAITLVLMVIVLSNSFIKILQGAAAGTLSNDVLFQLLGFEVLQILGPVVPAAFFFAILYAMGRLYRDSEMVALAACGIGMRRLFRSLLLVSIPVALVTGWFSLHLLPRVNFGKLQIYEEQAQEKAELSASVAGRFNEFSRGELTFYVGSMSKDKTRLRDIFIQNRQSGKLGLVTATEGYQYTDPDTGDAYLVLTQGRRYEGDPGASDYNLGEFDKYAVRIGQRDPLPTDVPVWAQKSSKLIRSEGIEDRSELQYRLLFPVAVLVFTVISLPLGKSLPREGIYGKLVLALFFYFIFFNLQAVSGSWMIKGVTPEWLGRWWVHPVILGLAALVFFYKSPRALKVRGFLPGRRTK